MIRVGICDDDPVARQLLEVIVGSAPELDVVVVCGTGEEAIRHREPHVDVWLMDLRLPGISGQEACEILLRQEPSPRVVFMTSYPDGRVADRLRSGASGYLFKDERIEHIVHAITAAAAGYSVGSPQVVTRLLDQSRPPLRIPDGLIRDEIDERLVALILDGASTRAASRSLHLSESAIKKRVAALMRRVGVASRPELVAKLNRPV